MTRREKKALSARRGASASFQFSGPPEEVDLTGVGMLWSSTSGMAICLQKATLKRREASKGQEGGQLI